MDILKFLDGDLYEVGYSPTSKDRIQNILPIEKLKIKGQGKNIYDLWHFDTFYICTCKQFDIYNDCKHKHKSNKFKYIKYAY